MTIAATFMDDNTMLNFFVDVPAGAYYYDAVPLGGGGRHRHRHGRVHFSPDAPCTHIVNAFLWRASGSPW